VPRPKQRTKGLRERGVASALAVLAEEGVVGLTTRTVALRANASVPAIYEVFGDKAGLVREVFFEGFRMLGDELARVPSLEDPLESIRSLAEAFRQFIVTRPVLAQIMFSRPFVAFDPTKEEDKAGVKVRKIFVHHIEAAVDSGALVGEPTDIAHLFFAFIEGMAAAESGQRLGGSKQSVNRRWRLGLNALINGLSPVLSARRATTRPTDGAASARRRASSAS
jgi:AcrR family transcriptional regulator